MQEVLRIFVEAGAPKAILYEAKPHIGTDPTAKAFASMGTCSPWSIWKVSRAL